MVAQIQKRIKTDMVCKFLIAMKLSYHENCRKRPLQGGRNLSLFALNLNKEEKAAMYDLVGKQRDSVAPDLPKYIKERDYVSAALRTARDLDAGEAEWLQFVEELKKRKG
ncbi:MAG: XRE family transcriptional regulator [Ruthenibacterium sp.]